MKRFTTVILMSFITLLVFSLPALAQRGGGGDRGRGGDRGGGGGDFRARILERIDANGNGIIEPNEAQGRAAGFVERMARDAGMQPGQPLPISRLTGSGSGSNRSRGNETRNDDNKSSGQEEDEFPTIPRFGDETIANFGLSPLTLAGKIVDLEKKYDRRTIENVQRTLDRYDKNKNGILDHSEWSAVQWRSDPRDSDLDKDGILTKAEMVERFAKRERGEERSRDERRGRGDDRESSRRGGGGGEREEGDRGGGGRGRGRGGFDPTAMIARMDRNQDGKIGPDEVDERARGWIQQRFQIDLSKPVEIEKIRQQIQEASGRGGRDNASSRNGRSQSGEKEKEEQPKEAYKVDGSSRLKGRLSYRSAGRSLPSQLPDWWEDRDEDANGQVTLREFAKTRNDETIRQFKDYDLNDDGLITTNEATVLEEEN